MFSRGSRSSGRHARDDRGRRQSRQQRSLAAEVEAVEKSADEAAAADGPAEPVGPYDRAQAPPNVARLDLGSLQVPSVPGVEVRVQANAEGVIQQVYLVHGESVLQLGAFAAPRTESIWDEVRSEIRRSLFTDGVAAEEVSGDYGTELRARVRTPQGLRDLRFVGVSGPRWLVRAVYQGPAAVDPSQAGPLAECLRGLVVDRGPEARPVKEPLPLRLSSELAAQLPARAAGVGPAAAGGGAAPSGGGGAAGAGGQASGRAVNGTRPPSARPAGGALDGDVSTSSASPRRKPSPRPRRD